MTSHRITSHDLTLHHMTYTTSLRTGRQVAAARFARAPAALAAAAVVVRVVAPVARAAPARVVVVVAEQRGRPRDEHLHTWYHGVREKRGEKERRPSHDE